MLVTGISGLSCEVRGCPRAGWLVFMSTFLLSDLSYLVWSRLGHHRLD